MTKLGMTLLVCGFVFTSACATKRGILDIQVSSPSNMQSSSKVKIVNVSDSRKFELHPKDAFIPSLKDGQIDNVSITSRAIARKRNGYGRALGDILLPEGRTVRDVVTEALQRALNEKGYTVVDKNDPGYENAFPLEADIRQFWAWFTPGFFAAKLEFISELTIKSEILNNKGQETAKGYVLLHTQLATGGAWSNTINMGLDNLVGAIKLKLRSP